MKKLLVAVLTAVTFMATAQEAPKVTSAIIALRGNELVEAKGFIDEATTIIDGKNLNVHTVAERQVALQWTAAQI